MNEANQLVAEVIFLATQVQNKTDYITFVRFYGHVDKIEVDVSSQEDYNDKLIIFETYTDREDSIENLKSAREKLLQFLDEGEIDLSKLNKITHYTL